MNEEASAAECGEVEEIARETNSKRPCKGIIQFSQKGTDDREQRDRNAREQGTGQSGREQIEKAEGNFRIGPPVCNGDEKYESEDARRHVADRDRQAGSVGESSEFLLLQPQPVAIGAARVGGDQERRGTGGKRSVPTLSHQRRMVWTANWAVSPSLPTDTQPASAPRSYTP